MRTALYIELCEITEFGSRVFQSYSAPDNTVTPYAVIKLLDDDPVVENMLGSMMSFSVFIYGSPNSFISLDALAILVRNKLNKVTITSTTGLIFRPEYVKTLQDYKEENGNFMKRCDFDVPGVRP